MVFEKMTVPERNLFVKKFGGPEDEGSMFLRNVCTFLQIDMALQ
jgi:hypothetical protein